MYVKGKIPWDECFWHHKISHSHFTVTQLFKKYITVFICNLAFLLVISDFIWCSVYDDYCLVRLSLNVWIKSGVGISRENGIICARKVTFILSHSELDYFSMSGIVSDIKRNEGKNLLSIYSHFDTFYFSAWDFLKSISGFFFLNHPYVPWICI